MVECILWFIFFRPMMSLFFFDFYPPMNFSFFFHIFFIFLSYRSKYKQHTFHCTKPLAPTKNNQQQQSNQKQNNNRTLQTILSCRDFACSIQNEHPVSSRPGHAAVVRNAVTLCHMKGRWDGELGDLHCPLAQCLTFTRAVLSTDTLRHSFLATPGCWRALGDRWQSGLWDVSTVVFVLGDCCCWSFVFKRLLHIKDSLGVCGVLVGALLHVCWFVDRLATQFEMITKDTR